MATNFFSLATAAALRTPSTLLPSLSVDLPLIARHYRQLALSVNTSCVTAIGNDYVFDQVFSRQLEALARQGDIGLGFSTSGNSPNVLRGISTAKKLGLHTVAFTGSSGGKLKHAANLDLCICAPSSDTPRIQECHILIGHIVSELVEQELFHAQGRISGS